MEKMKRFAIYYAPEPGAFANRAAGWLGWDAASGAPVAHPHLPALPRPLTEITAEPRKYGFHGTIKAPFRLAAGATPAGLDQALAALAAETAPVTLPALALTRIGRFLALCPEGDTAPLLALAARVVQRMDSFRAPLTQAEIARRRPERLTPRQRDLLGQWGYPYVLEEFRFHLTLTGALDPWEIVPVESAALGHFVPVLPVPFCIRDLCLFGEDEAGAFHLLHRYALTG